MKSLCESQKRAIILGERRDYTRYETHPSLTNERELGYGEGGGGGRGHHRWVPGSLELVGWFMGLQGFRRPGWFSQRRIYWSRNYSLFLLPFLPLPSVNIRTAGTAKLFSRSLGSFSPSVSTHSLTRRQPPSLTPLSFSQSVLTLTQSEGVLIRQCSFRDERYWPSRPSRLIESPIAASSCHSRRLPFSRFEPAPLPAVHFCLIKSQMLS